MKKLHVRAMRRIVRGLEVSKEDCKHVFAQINARSETDENVVVRRAAEFIKEEKIKAVCKTLSETDDNRSY